MKNKKSNNSTSQQLEINGGKMFKETKENSAEVFCKTMNILLVNIEEFSDDCKVALVELFIENPYFLDNLSLALNITSC